VSFRFLADENIDSDIVQGLRSREPAIDILDVKTAGLRRASDPDLLEIAAEQGRILITYDRNTITRHFYDRLAAGKSSPGVFIVPTFAAHCEAKHVTKEVQCIVPVLRADAQPLDAFDLHTGS
jgi:predicted nuclease of predicted toxin-antitoxin system